MAGQDADVLVIGAGTAGAAASLLCARRGLRVSCLDARPLDRAGARWVNGVPAWCFDVAGLARPSAIPDGDGADLPGARAEQLRAGVPFHLVGGWGPDRLIARGHHLIEVDMRLLLRRLHRLGRQAGVRFVGDARVQQVRDDIVETSAGALTAAVVVDASGIGGAGLLGRSPPPPALICSASQQVHRVSDPQAAAAYFARNGVAPGETLCFTGVAGGYSVVNLQLERDTVSILTGSIPGGGEAIPGGPALAARFVAEHPWVGEQLFGGSRPIPLTLPAPVAGQGRVALLGDAAGQVFAVHGSGIGPGLVAAGMLAEVLAQGGTPWDYGVAWHRAWGPTLGVAWRFARFTAELRGGDDGGEVTELIHAGVLTGTAVALGLDQRLALPPLGELSGITASAVRNWRWLPRLASAARDAARIAWLYRRYPKRAADLDVWTRKLHAVPGVAEVTS